MSVKLSPVCNSQIIDANGNPASGWKVYTYQAGSSTPLATYTSADGTTAQANPIILNALGRPANPIWLTSGLSYKFVVKDANDVEQFTFDNLGGVNDTSVSVTQWQPSGLAPTYVSAASFTLSGDQTSEFHVGRRVQFTVTAGTVYGTITASAYTSLTTVTVGMDAGMALDSGLSAVNLSILRADRTAMPIPVQVNRQKLINGGAEVASRTSLSLTTSAQYGPVDLVALWASGGAVSAGTLQQVTTASVGRTGKAARAAGVTLTGAGQISWRYRMEAKDAVKFKNQLASFQIAVMHDVGSNVNYTIIIRKPTAADTFSSTTVISTGIATAVVSGTATVLTAQAVSMGDCSNGIEIEVQAACGAVTTKNFDFTEWQLEEGPICTAFERRDYQDDERRCRRYLPVWEGSGSVASLGTGQMFTTTSGWASVPLDVAPRVDPTGISANGSYGIYSNAGSSVALSSLTFGVGGLRNVVLSFTASSASFTAGQATTLVSTTAGAKILFTGCEL